MNNFAVPFGHGIVSSERYKPLILPLTLIIADSKFCRLLVCASTSNSPPNLSPIIASASVFQRLSGSPTIEIQQFTPPHLRSSQCSSGFHGVAEATRSPPIDSSRWIIRILSASEEQNNMARSSPIDFRLVGRLRAKVSHSSISSQAPYRDERNITSVGSQSHAVTLLPLWRGRIGCPPSAAVVPRCGSQTKPPFIEVEA
ncbi:hypothetical protein Scep_011461 [Stephania cephalantha]|uniref:Uncharacterized protein n=1 Tax=Stephania cephalantha TaxID=152367 RepID=A0AAP0P5V8_9MAGN